MPYSWMVVLRVVFSLPGRGRCNVESTHGCRISLFLLLPFLLRTTTISSLRVQHLPLDSPAESVPCAARAVRGRRGHAGHGLWVDGNVAPRMSNHGHRRHGRGGAGNAQGDAQLLRGRTHAETALIIDHHMGYLFIIAMDGLC